jgi:hypothetical protein
VKKSETQPIAHRPLPRLCRPRCGKAPKKRCRRPGRLVRSNFRPTPPCVKKSNLPNQLRHRLPRLCRPPCGKASPYRADVPTLFFQRLLRRLSLAIWIPRTSRPGRFSFNLPRRRCLPDTPDFRSGEFQSRPTTRKQLNEVQVARSQVGSGQGSGATRRSNGASASAKTPSTTITSCKLLKTSPPGRPAPHQPTGK